jgi:NAD(P)H-dependent FMN reductase
MTTIIGLSGSLRRTSFQTAILKAAAGMMPPGVTLEVRTLHGIPLYDGDAETASGIPAAVAKLKDEIAAAHGLLIAVPEYNNSFSGVLKNGLDWMSRPPGEAKRVFGGKPTAIAGATSGPFATLQAQTALLPVLRILGAELWTGSRLAVAKITASLDAEGNVADEELKKQIGAFAQGFAAWVVRHHRP